MTKMLYETWIKPVMAQVKEDFGLNNLWKYIRYYRMYLERFAIYQDKTNLTRYIEDKLFWSGKVAVYKDNILETVVVASIDSEKKNANGELVEISISGENGYHKNHLKVGKEVVVLYADESHIPPVLYIWAIANEVITREEILRTQDNMLRKPIMIDGVGEDLDNAIVKASNILSGVTWLNRKGKGRDKNVMDSKDIEVLNLQVGNAYKGAEILHSRKHFEELICDYLGYGTTKNEKRERMNIDEVNNENSIGKTFYKSAVRLHEKFIDEVKSTLNVDLKLIKCLTIEEDVKEVKEDVSVKNKME